MNVRSIANQIKATLSGFDEQKMYHQMLSHYKLLKLIGDEGKWVLPALQEISTTLLPNDFGESAAKAFVDEMAGIAEKNPYFINLFSTIHNERFESISQGAKEVGATVFPDVVAFSLVLERLSVAMYHDLKLVLALIEYFKSCREKPEAFRYRNFFHKLKLESVERPFYQRSLDRLKTGVVPPTAFRWTLPMNITEACVTDYIKGNKSNAKAGWPLVVNRPGAKENDPGTGAGPSRWSADKKAVSLHMPLAKEWADLYQTWNMAFVSQFSVLPYLLPKLFIPQVARYQDKPNDYIYNRVLALYVTLNYSGFKLAIKERTRELDYDWSDKKLTDLWGRSNLECARLYKKAVSLKKNGNKASDANLRTVLSDD